MLITRVDGRAAEALDLDMVKRKLKLSTRNNIQIILRSVLRFAAKRGYIPAIPTNMPSLKSTGQCVLEIPSDEQVTLLLLHGRKSHRLSFLLMSDTGLRPNEVRALRRRDVQLRYENGEPLGRFITIREGWSHGEVHTPKTGQREIPISPDLARELAPVMDGDRDGHVALSHRGMRWGQHGLAQAFERAMKKAGLKGWSVYCLRHYAITSWLRAGIPVHVVQRMAGHVHLSTTQRYVHFLKADLEDAARKIAARGVGDESLGANTSAALGIPRRTHEGLCAVGVTDGSRDHQLALFPVLAAEYHLFLAIPYRHEQHVVHCQRSPHHFGEGVCLAQHSDLLEPVSYSLGQLQMEPRPGFVDCRSRHF